MLHYTMQANDSVTGALVAWVSNGASDFAGTNYPGPNSPTAVRCVDIFDDGVTGSGPGGADGSIQYKNGSGFSGTSDATIVDNGSFAAFRFGAIAANNGRFRFGAGASVAPILIAYGLKSDGTTTVPLIRWGAGANNRLHFGDAATGAVDSFVFGGPFFQVLMSASTFQVDLSGLRFEVTGSAIDCKSTPLTNVASINGTAVVMPSTGAALNDADQTITANQGALRRIPTLTGNRVYDIDNTNAVDDETIVLYRTGTEAFTATIRDHADSTIATFPASTKLAGSFQKTVGGNFVFRGFQRIA